MAGVSSRDGVRPAVLVAVVSALAAVVLAVVLVAVLVTPGGDRPATVRARPRPAATAPEPPPPSSTIAPAVGELATLRIAQPHLDGYDRDLFGGDWADADGDCQNTRAEVLIAESQVPVTFTGSPECTVATGQWVDPWSGTVSTSARAVDVDHTVPLANAWRAGAWAWTPERRRAFANDLADSAHLIAIPLAENRAKADDGPDAWRPPVRESWCAYAQVWTAIKARWDLSATPSEWVALEEMAATC